MRNYHKIQSKEVFRLSLNLKLKVSFIKSREFLKISLIGKDCCFLDLHNKLLFFGY